MLCVAASSYGTERRKGSTWKLRRSIVTNHTLSQMLDNFTASTLDPNSDYWMWFKVFKILATTKGMLSPLFWAMETVVANSKRERLSSHCGGRICRLQSSVKPCVTGLSVRRCCLRAPCKLDQSHLCHNCILSLEAVRRWCQQSF